MGEPATVVQSTGWDKVRGILLCSFSLLSTLFGSVYILTPILPLLFIDHHTWRKIVDRLVGYWVMLPSGFIELAYGTKIRVTGTKIEHSEPALIIMNHRTCLDWMFFWNALIRMDPWLLTSEKISLKGILKNLPGAGWAMTCNAFMFLSRSFEKDSSRIEELIDYYANSGFNYQLLLFPEGTDKDDRATERSRRYAEKKGLKHYAHVLHPKTKGFTFIVKKMREAGYIKNVYDVTVAYADMIVQSEVDLVRLGACPRSVHFHVRQLDAASLPQEEDELAKWLTDLWEKKEQSLNNFYATESVDDRRLADDANVFDITPRLRAIQLSAAALWILLSVTWLYIFFTFPLQYTLGALTVSVFVGAHVVYGGMEMLAIQRAREERNRQGAVRSGIVRE